VPRPLATNARQLTRSRRSGAPVEVIGTRLLKGRGSVDHSEQPSQNQTVARLTELPQIERLPLAKVVLPDGHPEAVTTREAPVYAFLIRHPDGAILVDTGVGRGSAFVDEVYRPTVVDLADALAECGIDHRDVVAVVNSHLHFDHCGQNPEFYGLDVPVYVQTPEVEAAKALYYADPDWSAVPPGQLRRVNGDEELAVGVRLLATPGHTSGHQSVPVEGGDDVVVIAAQSVWSATEFASQKRSQTNVEDLSLYEAAEDSIRRLRSLNPSLAYFSHDSEVYRP
jgi:N-acyl homoserine lactone hydrolase